MDSLSLFIEKHIIDILVSCQLEARCDYQNKFKTSCVNNGLRALINVIA